MKIRNGLLTLLLFVLAAAGMASGQATRTYSLINGDSLVPASGFDDGSGFTTFFGGSINGQVANATAPAVFTLSVAFKESGEVDAAGNYIGTILAPNSSFAVTESAGRKSVSTSGRINSGTVTYRLIDGRAEVISVVSGDLTVWEGKNKSRKAVGTGTLDYGTSVEGSGTMVLNFF